MFVRVRKVHYTGIHQIATLSMPRLPLPTDLLYAEPFLAQAPARKRRRLSPCASTSIDFQTKYGRLALGVDYLAPSF
jgi:hypothetical protein